MTNKKHFIYFPSLSSGGAKSWLQKNEFLTDKYSSRFYDKNHTPDYLYHPYFLISAGHNYKKENIRTEMGLDDSFVIGDSGGYQISTGAIKWEKSIRETIFKWLEKNSDIAVNLDIPPYATMQGRFQECFDISIDNFKYFETHQTGKTKFLNVLQGNSLEEYQYWYNAVKDFEFNGWAIGGAINKVNKLIMVISLLLESKELEKQRNQYIHILGMSGIDDFIVIEMLQQLLNQKFDNRIQLSTDSSSPALRTTFGHYFYDIDWTNLNLKYIHLPRLVDSTELLPCKFKSCPACENRTFKDFENWKTKDYMYLTAHNMHIFIDTIKNIHNLISTPSDIFQGVLPKDHHTVYLKLKEIFESNAPLQVYQKYINVFNKITNKTTEPSIPLEKVNNLFNF